MTHDIQVSFAGGKLVNAQVGHFRIQTDLPRAHGGEDSAPNPFELFLASIATCAGVFVRGFCEAQGLSTEGITLLQRVDYDPRTQLPRRIGLTLQLPASFPEQHRPGILRAAEGCKVKRTIVAAPHFEVTTTLADPARGEQLQAHA